MARENFCIGAFYNITKNQDIPIKTVGRDSFLSPKTPKNKLFRVTQPPGVAQPLYSREDNQTQTYNLCPNLIEIGSKTAEKNCTNRHYENNGHLAVSHLAATIIPEISDPVYQVNVIATTNIHKHYHHLSNNWTAANIFITV